MHVANQANVVIVFFVEMFPTSTDLCQVSLLGKSYSSVFIILKMSNK